MKTAGRIFVAYLVLTLLFTGALTAVFLIPSSAIEGNVRQSVLQLNDEGPKYTTQIGFVQPYKLAVFSDCLMMGIAYCADNSQPLQSAMNARFMMVDGSPINGSRIMMEHPDDQRLQPVIYSRYWHGNQVIIRPLLSVMPLNGIRTVNVVLLTLLWLTLLVVMWQRVGRADALIVAGCLAAVMVPSVPLCLNYVSTFYIALVASVLVLLWKPATARWQSAVILFFVIGAATTFLDLLTTPMVAMAVPLVVYMLYRKPEKSWRAVILLSLAWLLGYASLWATKWLLAILITGHAAWQDAMSAVTQRTVGHGEQDYMLWCLKHTLIALGCFIAIASVLIAFTKNRWDNLRRHGWMLLIALSAFVWALVLLEHTWHHLHFTWRTFVVTMIGIALFMRYSNFKTKPKEL